MSRPRRAESEAAVERPEMRAPEALALVASSALFSFVLFKLLSFFLTPANLVLCFLIAVHPAGVLLADRWLVRRDRRAVRLYLLALAWSVGSLLLLRHVHPALPQPGAQPGLALAVVLGGTAVGIGLGYAGIRWVGALGLTAIAAGTAAVLALPRGRARLGAAAVSALVAFGSAAWPSFDAAWVGLIQPEGPSTDQEHLRRGGEFLFSRWDRHAYTQVIQDGDVTVGAYDNFKYWDVQRERRPQDGIPADALIFHALEPGSAVAIVGVGGGRQVQEAQWAEPTLRIDAFEINGSIVEAFTRLHPSANGGAYVAPHVRVVDADGRRAIAEGTREYDCIYLPDAGTAFAYYRNLVADPQFLYTRESYQGYLSRLRAGGVLVTAFARPSNPDGVLTRRVTDILAELDVDLHVLTSAGWEIVVASRRGSAAATLARLDELAGRSGLTKQAPDAPSRERATGDYSGFHVPYFLYSVMDRLPGHFARALALGAVRRTPKISLPSGRSGPSIRPRPRSSAASSPVRRSTGHGASRPPVWRGTAPSRWTWFERARRSGSASRPAARRRALRLHIPMISMYSMYCPPTASASRPRTSESSSASPW